MVKMPLKSSMELFIVLLYANNTETITGVTRLIKIMFLLVKEGGFSEFEEELEFEAYDYGPWSASVYTDYPMTLEEIGVLELGEIDTTEIDTDELYSSETWKLERGKIKTFSLTKEGENVGKTFYERLTSEEQYNVEEIKRKWNHSHLRDLVEYVYKNYVEYTDRSKIRDQLLSKLNVSSRIKELIGIIPPTSLEDEKRLIRDYIRGRTN